MNGIPPPFIITHAFSRILFPSLHPNSSMAYCVATPKAGFILVLFQTETKMTKSKTEKARDEFDELMNKMSDVKKKWDEESGSDTEDATGNLLNQAIELALEQGRGWSPGEKEQYLESVMDDDFVSVLPGS
jgi:hypothetical protein